MLAVVAFARLGVVTFQAAAPPSTNIDALSQQPTRRSPRAPQGGRNLSAWPPFGQRFGGSDPPALVSWNIHASFRLILGLRGAVGRGLSFHPEAGFSKTFVH